MIRQMFADATNLSSRSYATEAAAVKAFERVTRALFDGEPDALVSYMVFYHGGRFYPVFLPSADQIQLAITYVHKGVASVRT